MPLEQPVMRTTLEAEDAVMAASSRTLARSPSRQASGGRLLAQAGPGECRPDQPGLLDGEGRLFATPGAPGAPLPTPRPAPRPVLVGEEPDRVGADERAETWFSTHVVDVQ